MPTTAQDGTTLHRTLTRDSYCETWTDELGGHPVHNGTLVELQVRGRWDLPCERVRQAGGHEALSRCACLGRGLGGGRMRSRRLTRRCGGRLACGHVLGKPRPRCCSKPVDGGELTSSGWMEWTT